MASRRRLRARFFLPVGICQAVVDWTTAAIALVTIGLLWRFKIREPYIVVAAGGLGILLH